MQPVGTFLLIGLLKTRVVGAEVSKVLLLPPEQAVAPNATTKTAAANTCFFINESHSSLINL